jgi:hypothetical protein
VRDDMLAKLHALGPISYREMADVFETLLERDPEDEDLQEAVAIFHVEMAKPGFDPDAECPFVDVVARIQEHMG